MSDPKSDSQCAAHTNALIDLTRAVSDGFGQGDKRMSRIEDNVVAIKEGFDEFKKETRAEISQLKADVRLTRKLKYAALTMGAFLGLSSFWWVGPVVRFIGKVAQQ